MNLQLRDEILSANFRPTEAAAQFEAALSAKLGGPHRYEIIRLMLGRSLTERSTPQLAAKSERIDGKVLRGRALFGEDVDLWMAIFALDGGMKEGTVLEDFRATVEAHWSRGSTMLKEDFERAENDIVQMATSLANLLPATAGNGASSSASPRPKSHGALSLRVGPLSENAETGEKVEFVLNGVGSPHLVLMGKTGQGKTRVGVELAKQILTATSVPMIFIDPKPDFAPGGNYHGAFDGVCEARNVGSAARLVACRQSGREAWGC